MNILFFLTPKSEVAFIENTFTLRQILEKMEIHRYSAIPILSGNGEYMSEQSPRVIFSGSARKPD